MNKFEVKLIVGLSKNRVIDLCRARLNISITIVDKTFQGKAGCK